MTWRISEIVAACILAGAIVIHSHAPAPPAPASIRHTCVDNTHQTCDGECPCDGFECDGFSPSRNWEYQLRLELDSTYVYDGDRLVGVSSNENPSGIFNIILEDNQ